jgi:peptidyl-prolyl cis-trans isomerase SDCCAG10
MANENKPNSNHSQFFFTLDACDWLRGKHTIFGKITGNTIFNGKSSIWLFVVHVTVQCSDWSLLCRAVLRMGDVEVDENDRPIEPPRILSGEVLANPFDDIVPRQEMLFRCSGNALGDNRL